MRPINQPDITAARTKLGVALLLTLGLFPLVWWMHHQLPMPAEAALPPAGIAAADTFDQARIQAIEQQLTQTVSALQTTNVMVVVDATPGMENALEAGASALEPLLSGTSGQVGAAAYRDAAEGAWGYVEAPGGSDVPRWLRRLSTDVQYDQDDPEAVYYGLQQALQSAVFQPGQTNVLILLGDAGNHAQDALTQVEPITLRDEMGRLGVHFAAVQLRHPEGPAYEQFGEQLRQDFLSINTPLEPVAWEHGLRYRTDLFPTAMLATCRFGETVSATALEAVLENYLREVNTAVAERVRSLEAVQAGTADGSETELPVAASEVAYLQAYHRYQHAPPERVVEEAKTYE